MHAGLSGGSEKFAAFSFLGDGRCGQLGCAAAGLCVVM